jgi:hypothetical protein
VARTNEAGAEIGVTPEMIEAGRTEFHGTNFADFADASLAEMFTAAYLAMRRLDRMTRRTQIEGQARGF